MDFGFFTLFFIAISLSLSLCFSVSPSALFRFPLSNQCLRARTARPLVSFNTFDAEFVLFIFLVRKKRMDRPCTYIFGGTFRLKDSHTHTQRRRGPNTSPHETYRGWGGAVNQSNKKSNVLYNQLTGLLSEKPSKKCATKAKEKHKNKTQTNKKQLKNGALPTHTHTHGCWWIFMGCLANLYFDFSRLSRLLPQPLSRNVFCLLVDRDVSVGSVCTVFCDIIARSFFLSLVVSLGH